MNTTEKYQVNDSSTSIERNERKDVIGYTWQTKHSMTRFRVEGGHMELVIGFKKFDVWVEEDFTLVVKEAD